MELDSSHPTVMALKALLPEADVYGGSFSHWLPDPLSLSKEGRRQAIASARESARRKCLLALLKQVGHGNASNLLHGGGGEPIWPFGYVGSLTHKATIVLGAIVNVSVISFVGIDVEIIRQERMPLERDFIAPEGLPSEIDDALGTLLAFSAKEAAFKAQYPQTQKRLDFSDVRLEWDAGNGTLFTASVVIPDFPPSSLQCILADKWIISTVTPHKSVG